MPIRARTYPVLSPILQRIWGARAADVEEIHPQETEAVTPPAMLPDMLERVTATDEHSTLAFHLNAARATEVTHAAVLRLTYRDALVCRSGFAALRAHHKYGKGWNVRDLLGDVPRTATLRYCHSYVAWRYFGHWLTDSIPSAAIDPEQGGLWMPHDPSWHHADGYLAALDLKPERSTVMHADTLTLYQDYGQGSHKQARFDHLRARLRQRFGEENRRNPVYIRRGQTGASRQIRNEAELMDDLASRGWTIIDVARSSTEEMQRVLCSAQCVVSIDGSHLDHAHLSLPKDSIMIVLLPQDRFTMRQPELRRAHGARPGIVVLKGTQRDGYVADISEILQTIDLGDAGCL